MWGRPTSPSSVEVGWMESGDVGSGEVGLSTPSIVDPFLPDLLSRQRHKSNGYFHGVPHS